jgi:hypothetical protein
VVGCADICGYDPDAGGQGAFGSVSKYGTQTGSIGHMSTGGVTGT